MLIDGRIAMVTGAGGGLGAACAQALAQQGAGYLYLVDLDERKGKSVQIEISHICPCEFIAADVTDAARVREIFRGADEGKGAPEILVNCAGINNVDKLFDMKDETWDRLMDVNLKSVLLYAREALKRMRERRYGRVVSMASIAGQIGGIRTSPAYAVSKAGIICLTKSLAKEFVSDGITVNCVSPGLVNTEMTKMEGFHYSASEIPMGYAAGTTEISDVVLFLASDLSRYMTGQCLEVNGGMHM